ncbi:mandelate racemase [Rhizobium sp. P32RR-XVIII]|nr:mandelate racemase [Rhizobium sp. P32RR-XVIII]
MHHLTIRSLSATPVAVPLKRPLRTSSQIFSTVPLLIVELSTQEGITGNAYGFCYTDVIARSMQTVVTDLGTVLAGQRVAPHSLSKRIAQHFKLIGLGGPLPMVASTVDVAAWDALAVAAGMPLADLLGAERRPVPAYNSCGLSLIGPQEAADEAEELLAGGFRAVKMRLGRPNFADDLAAVRAVRGRLPSEVALMVDFNQALTFADAMQRCPALDDEGIYWIEEPIRHDDYMHLAQVSATSKTPIQIGENCVGARSVAEALETIASDYLMFDLDRIGGVTGWRVAAGLAAAHNREVSSHLSPEVSAHLLAGTATMHWLEYVDWAAALLQEPLRIVDGMAIASELAGNGLRWDAEAVARYRLS